MKPKKQAPRARIAGKFRRCYRCGKYIRIGQTYEIIDGRVRHGNKVNCG